MSNLRFTRKSRHPRRVQGENSLGQNEREENKFYTMGNVETFNDSVKDRSQFDNKKQNQVNFK
jgi:hypothetical protein